jgi:predicted ATPase
VLSGTGQLLTIVGEAGVGKSRLAEELLDDCHRQGMAVFRGDCPFYGASIPYFPWAEILKTIFNFHDEDTIERKCERLIQGIAEIDAHLVPWVPILDDILGDWLPDTPLTATLDPEKRKTMIFEVIREVVRYRAAQTPLVLLFEDTHWMDDLSWELLNSVVRAIPHSPFLLVVVSRPDPKLTVWDTVDDAITVHLTNLSEDAACDLITSLLSLPAIPEALSTLILTRSQGNPFFIEEIIHALIETGVILKEDGQHRIVGDLAVVELPDTIQGAIMSRLDRLDEESKSIIKVAAVLGQQFRYSFLRGILPYGVDDRELRDRLLRLSHLDLILMGEEEPDPEYRFKHILTQEVVYDSLPFASRKVLHHDIGRYIETTFDENLEEHYELLAYHYNRTDDEERALTYLMKAGAKTKRFYANQTAIGFYKDALHRLSQHEEETTTAKIECHTMLGDILTLIGRYPEALSNYEATLPLAEQLGNQYLRATTYQRLGQLKSRVGEYAEALQYHQQALTLLEEARGERALEGALLNDIGTNYCWMGDYRTALDYFERSRIIRRDLGDKRHEAFCGMNMGTVYSLLGDRIRAVELLEQAHQVFQEVGDKEREARVLVNLADVRIKVGDTDGAEQACRKALEILKEIGDREVELMTLERLGRIDAQKGDYTAALTTFRQVVTLSRELGDATMEAAGLNNMGLVHWHLGSYRQALEACQTALGQAKACQARDTEAAALHTLGLIAGSLGDAPAALDSFLEADRIAGEIEDRTLQGHIRIDIGRRLLSIGKRQDAVQTIAEGLEKVKQAGDTKLELYGHLSLAETFLHLEDLRQAQTLIDEVKSQVTTIRDRETEIQFLTLKADFACQTGCYNDALKDYEAVLTLARTIRARKEEAWTLYKMGQLFYKVGENDRAVEYYREAVHHAVDIEDRPLQEKLLKDLLHVEHDLIVRAAQEDQEAAKCHAEIYVEIERLRRAMRSLQEKQEG